MGITKATRRALSVIGTALVVTLANSASTLASPVIHAEPAPVVTAAVTSKPVAPRAAAHPKHQAAPKPAPHERKLRRAKGSEITPAVAKKARQIINANYTKPFGTEIPFEIGGTHYVGRIERHYHPPGGKLHPWGYHHGCSVFVAVDSAS